MGNSETSIGDLTQWYVVNVDDNRILAGYHINETLVSKQTPFQRLQVLDLDVVGKSLILDGEIQSCELDEALYHEYLVHPAMLMHPNPKRVFVGGGGEGATVREILKHTTLEKVVMCDIDRECVEYCREHLPHHSAGIWDDPRFELVIGDAKAYLENLDPDDPDQRFDLIVLDLSDPLVDSPCYQLYTVEFYRMCVTRLHPGGIVVTQAASSAMTDMNDVFSPIVNTFKNVPFESTLPFSTYIGSFLSTWGFCLGVTRSEDANVLGEGIDAKIEERILGGADALKFYDEISHRSIFALSKAQRAILDAETTVLSTEKQTFADVRAFEKRQSEEQGSKGE